MTAAQIEGIVRSLTIALGGISGAAGFLSDIDWVAVGGALATIAGVAWSVYSNRIDRLVKQAAESPKVIEIIATPALAASVPSNKVIPPVGR
jgi:hypothetical protein